MQHDLLCKSMQNADILATPTLRKEKRNEREVLLQRPYINVNKHMTAMFKRFDARADEQARFIKATRDEFLNNHWQPLKAAHRGLYADLIHLVKLAMNNRLTLMGKDTEYIPIFAHDPEQPFSLFTNREELAKRSRKSESAIHRQLLRLEEAGIIMMRKFHGVNRNFELLINPEFIIISDLANLEFDPLLSKPENTQNKASKRGLRAKCSPYTNLQEPDNNKIMAVDSQEGALRAEATPQTPQGAFFGIPACRNNTTGDKTNINSNGNIGENTLSRDECLSFFYRNSGVQTQVKEWNKQGKTTLSLSDRIIPPVAPAPHAEIIGKQHHKNTLLYTDWLIKYAISKLFSSHTHYRPAIAAAFEMVAAHYWNRCITSQDFENSFTIYRWRIDAAARYAARTNFNLSNIYLTTYFDPNNMNGCSFARTRSWYVNARKFKTKRTENKMRAEVMRTLTAKTEEVLKAGTLSAYVRAESALMEKVEKREFPEWVISEFYRQCESLTNNLQYLSYGNCSEN